MLDVMLARRRMPPSTLPAPLRPGRQPPPVSAPFDTYRAADGLIVIAGQRPPLRHPRRHFGKPGWPDPRFATDAHRSDNDDALRIEIEEFTTGRTVTELCEIFDTAGIPNSPVLDFAEAVDGPIGTDRKLTAADPRTGHAYLGHPLLVDGTRPASTLPAPRLGEHNADFATAESTSSVAAPESAEPNN